MIPRYHGYKTCSFPLSEGGEWGGVVSVVSVVFDRVLRSPQRATLIERGGVRRDSARRNCLSGSEAWSRVVSVVCENFLR